MFTIFTCILIQHFKLYNVGFFINSEITFCFII